MTALKSLSNPTLQTSPTPAGLGQLHFAMIFSLFVIMSIQVASYLFITMKMAS